MQTITALKKIRWQVWFVLFLSAAAMAASVAIHFFIFNGLPLLEDEFTYLYQARTFAGGNLYIDRPYPASPSHQPFLIDCDENLDKKFGIQCDGKRLGKYPPGWPLLLAVGALLGAPWFSNMLFSGLNVALAYLIGREVYDEPAGIAAAVLLTASPIALLLNGTLMGHTSSFFFAGLFIYGLILIERRPRPLLWGAVSGAALGMLIAIRPLTAVGVALPFIIYSRDRLLLVWKQMTGGFFTTFKPLLMISLFTLLVGSLWPIYNYATTGKATTNLYLLVWDYDKIGFGPGHGPQEQGHQAEYAWVILKKGVRCLSRDLFGWASRPNRDIDPRYQCLYDKPGYSWVLLPLGFLFLRNNTWKKLLHKKNGQTKAEYWKGIKQTLRSEWMSSTHWSFLFLLMAASTFTVYFFYWIGSGLYSARYYYEVVLPLALISGAAVSAIAREAGQFGFQRPFYLFFALSVLATLIMFTPYRLIPLKGYECNNRSLINEVELLRESPDRKVLVLAYGAQTRCGTGYTFSWRHVAPLMALTDPYLKNDVIMLKDFPQYWYRDLVQQFPDRQLILMLDGVLVPVHRPD